MGTGFALSNPYFDHSHLERDEKEIAKSNLEEWIKERMPTGESLDERVFALFKFCASFVYHKNSGWMENSTHSQTAIRCSYFWSEDIQFSDCIITVDSWALTRDSLEITGPPMDTLKICMAKIKPLEA